MWMDRLWGLWKVIWLITWLDLIFFYENKLGELNTMLILLLLFLKREFSLFLAVNVDLDHELNLCSVATVISGYRLLIAMPVRHGQKSMSRACEAHPKESFKMMPLNTVLRSTKSIWSHSFQLSSLGRLLWQPWGHFWCSIYHFWSPARIWMRTTMISCRTLLKNRT